MNIFDEYFVQSFYGWFFFAKGIWDEKQLKVIADNWAATRNTLQEFIEHPSYKPRGHNLPVISGFA